eukprot:7314681-Heterocapsa_arctica.AAC.1
MLDHHAPYASSCFSSNLAVGIDEEGYEEACNRSLADDAEDVVPELVLRLLVGTLTGGMR